MEDKLEIYTKGTKAWFKDDEEGYVAATMESKQVTPRSVKMQFIIDATKQVDLV
jgi:myosin-5